MPLLPAASGQDGFGLLEAIVAIAILAGTLVAIFALGLHHRANHRGEQMLRSKSH